MYRGRKAIRLPPPILVFWLRTCTDLQAILNSDVVAERLGDRLQSGSTWVRLPPTSLFVLEVYRILHATLRRSKTWVQFPARALIESVSITADHPLMRVFRGALFFGITLPTLRTTYAS